MFLEEDNELYVKNLCDSVNEQVLFNSFIKFGMIESVKVMRNAFTHKSRGFGFITFKYPYSVNKAIDEMNDIKLHNNIINVYSKKKYYQINKKSLILILNLPESFTGNDLSKMTSGFGKVFSKSILNQTSESQEAVDKEVKKNKRVFLQFEEIKDSLKFQKKYNKKSDMIVVFTNLHSTLHIKGNLTSSNNNPRQDLINFLYQFGEFEMTYFNEEPQTNQYFAAVDFTLPINARKLYLSFKCDKSKFPFDYCIEPEKKQKKAILKQKKIPKNLKCVVVLKLNSMKNKIDSILRNHFNDILKTELIQGKLVINFKSESNLIRFVNEIENKQSCISSFIDGTEIEYPSCLVNSVKAKQWNQMKMMSQFQYNQMMNRHYHYNMGPIQSDLEIILLSPQIFKNRNKSDQKIMLMNAIKQKMYLMQDKRVLNQDFMNSIEKLFLKEPNISLQDKVDVLSNDQKFFNLLYHLEKN